MPMVPTSFVPGVEQTSTQTPRQSGPFVQPMENRAPGLLMQLGNTTEQAGTGLMREGQTIGDRIRDQLDDTAVKNAETQMLGTIQATLHGPTGYLNQRGQNAVNGYDDAAQAITKAKQDAEGTLTNDFQRRMFAPAADRHLITFGAEMNDHRFQQVASVSAKSATDRVDAHVPFAVNARAGWQQTDADGSPTGNFQAHLAIIQQEATHAANLMYGVAPDSDIAQSMVRGATTEVARGVVNGFLQDHAYKEAKTFFDAWNGKGMIDEKTAEVLGNAIKENGDREFTETTGNEAALKVLAAKSGGQNPYMAAANPKGLLEQGNLPIWNRPVVQNADGTHSSEYSVSFQDDQGREVLVPTVVDGKFLTADGKKPPEGSAAEKTMFQAAWDHYLKTGENLGKFDNSDDADAYADQLHNRSINQNAPVKPSFVYPVTGGSITQQYGAPEKNGQPHNGIDIAVPVGTQVKAPGSGSVLKVWDDEENGGGRSMLVKLDNGFTAGFAHLSATNYKPGDQVTEGQAIALSGNSGWNTSGAHLHYTMTDPDGKKVDPTSVNAATPQQKAADLNDFTDPMDAEAAKEIIRSTVPDAVLQKQSLAYIDTLQRNNWRQHQEIQQENYKQVQDQFFASGGDWGKVARDNPEGWAQLTEQQKYVFKKGLPREDDSDTKEAFILNDANQTVPWVQQHRMNFSDETYWSYLNRAKNMDDARQQAAGGNPTKLIAGKDFDKQIENTLLQGGMGAIANAKDGSDAQKQKGMIYDEIYNRQDALEQTQKRPLTRVENQQVIDSVLNDKVRVDQLSNPLLPQNHNLGWLRFVPGAAVIPYAMPMHEDPEQLNATVQAGNQRATYVNYAGRKIFTADIPQKYREYVTDDLEKSGIPPTEFDIAARWVDDGMPGGVSVAPSRSKLSARYFNNR